MSGANLTLKPSSFLKKHHCRSEVWGWSSMLWGWYFYSTKTEHLVKIEGQMDGENDMEMPDNFVLCSSFKMIAIVLENAPQKKPAVYNALCVWWLAFHISLYSWLQSLFLMSQERSVFCGRAAAKHWKTKTGHFACLTETEETTALCDTEAQTP